MYSPDPDRPTAARGVATVLNRELIDTSGAQMTTLIPGRATLTTVHWHAGRKLTLLNVYAPNTPAENETFWETLANKLETSNHRKPDIVLGDFNLVEESID